MSNNENGLQLKSTFTNVHAGKRGNAAEKIGSGWIVAWYDHEVVIGTVDHSQIQWADQLNRNEQFLQRARVFNTHQEVHIWKNGTQLNHRTRIDNDINDGSLQATDLVEADQMLVGTSLNGHQWQEERGMTLVLPDTLVKNRDNKKKLFVRTRHYITQTKIGQATYHDVRFCDLIWKEV